MGKKWARRAVLRNRLKRMARELFRCQKGLLPVVDCVVRLSASPTKATLAELRTDLNALLGRLQRIRLARVSPSSGPLACAAHTPPAV
jgi:ribonuclease P protein component